MAELKPYLMTARRHIGRNSEADAWSFAEARWLALVGNCRGLLARRAEGKPGSAMAWAAAKAIIQVADEAKPRAVLETVVALFLLADDLRYRFESDDAFRFQIARRVRGLAETNVAAYYDPASRRVKRVYRDLPPRAALMMGRMVADALGLAGMAVARLERREREQEQQEDRNYKSALSQLT